MLRCVPPRNVDLPALFSRSEKAAFFAALTLYGWLDPALSASLSETRFRRRSVSFLPHIAMYCEIMSTASTRVSERLGYRAARYRFVDPTQLEKVPRYKESSLLAPREEGRGTSIARRQAP
jgi:hypothetical protein